MKDPYAVLGLDKSASPDLLKARYKELRELYGEQRFKSGEEGNDGARKLQELEEAWILIDSDLGRRGTNEFVGDYGKVDALIRDGKYNEAQDVLDSISDRGGEWHYMQAIVFYKRDWLIEARTQLEMALQDDPSNDKYRNSLEKLKIAIQNPEKQGATAFAGNGATYGANVGNGAGEPIDQQSQAEQMSNCLSSCCCAYCLTDCLCTSMRCCF